MTQKLYPLIFLKRTKSKIYFRIYEKLFFSILNQQSASSLSEIQEEVSNEPLKEQNGEKKNEPNKVSKGENYNEF